METRESIDGGLKHMTRIEEKLDGILAKKPETNVSLATKSIPREPCGAG